MFCFQCQETSGNKGCTKIGVCGKKNSTSNLQDLLIFTTKGVAGYSQITSHLEEFKKLKKDINRYIINSLFMTITNANFDDNEIISEINRGIAIRDTLSQIASRYNLKLDEKYIILDELKMMDTDELINFASREEIGINRTKDPDIRSLRELLTYGLKGIAAYAEHAQNLGFENEDIFVFIQNSLLATIDDSLSSDKLLNLVLECGKYGVFVMELLDKANTNSFGNPEITKVKIGVGNRPGILISGHDLKDLKDLLEQSKNANIDIYTHSEMLPGHYYPELKKYSHFYGNYGNAWWKQKEEFESFNGPILFTTNCIVPPNINASYTDRVFTTNAAGFPEFKKIKTLDSGQKDFSEIIKLAQSCSAPKEIENGEIIGGFAHNQVVNLAPQIIENIKNGSIKRFVVMAGCDGRQKERNYYTDFAKNLSHDTIILTAGCAKYRYNKLNLGDINGIPRVLDAGQCNDSYSLVKIALALKEALNLDDINDLPIDYNIAWYEQKAVIVLLALLYLGVKNIHLGPTLPAFLSENVLNILVKNFNISAHK